MHILTVTGIRLVLNPSFLVLLLLLGALGRLPEAVITFGVVLIHELGHLVVARGHGLAVREVELLPFGGVARVEDVLELDPVTESSVALAGPLTNLLLIGGGLVLRAYEVLPLPWVDFFLRTNAVIAAFNLLPALPLDGGRVYRAYLSRAIGHRRATERTARLGRALSLLLALGGGAGLYLGYVGVIPIVLAFFLYVAAGREEDQAMYVFMRYLTRKKQDLKERGLMEVQQLVALAATPVKQVVGHFLPRKYHVVLVLDEEGKLQGMTTEREVIDALFDRGIEVPIGDLVHRA